MGALLPASELHASKLSVFLVCRYKAQAGGSLAKFSGCNGDKRERGSRGRRTQEKSHSRTQILSNAATSHKEPCRLGAGSATRTGVSGNLL